MKKKRNFKADNMPLGAWYGFVGEFTTTVPGSKAASLRPRRLQPTARDSRRYPLLTRLKINNERLDLCPVQTPRPFMTSHVQCLVSGPLNWSMVYAYLVLIFDLLCLTSFGVCYGCLRSDYEVYFILADMSLASFSFIEFAFFDAFWFRWCCLTLLYIF